GLVLEPRGAASGIACRGEPGNPRGAERFRDERHERGPVGAEIDRRRQGVAKERFRFPPARAGDASEASDAELRTARVAVRRRASGSRAVPERADVAKSDAFAAPATALADAREAEPSLAVATP